MNLQHHLRLGAELGISLTAIAALILAGCGGGASSSPGGTLATALVTPMKGQFCSSATVTVRDVNNAVVGTGAVSASGVVSVGNISSSSGAPYVVQVGSGATPSCYYDEVTGANATLPANTVALHAVIPSYADLTGASGVAVTPLTEMVYQYLNSKGALAIAASAVAANNAVASGFGLSDILQAPTLIGLGTTLAGSSSHADRYALATAALAQTAAASATAGQSTLDALLAQMPTFIASGVPAVTYGNAYGNFTGGASSVLAVPAWASAPAPGGSLDSLIGSGGSAGITCNTALFSGGVRDATSGELANYAQTYSGNTGYFDSNLNFVSTGNATLVFGADASLIYNTQSQTVSSVCYETAVPQLVVHFGADGHVDFKTNGSFTGVAPDGTTVIKSGSSATPPAAPGGLTATAVSATQVNLSWSAVSGAQGYRIYRSTTAGQAVAAMTDLLGGTTQAGTTYSNTGLTAGTTYYYKIVAVNATGDSTASTEASATTSTGVASVWTPHTETGWFFYDMLWDGAQFVGVTAASGSGVVGTSTDGVNWTLRAMFMGTGIAKAGSTYLVMGVGAATGSDIRTSTDTINWTNPYVVVGIESAVGNNSLFVGVSGGSYVATGQALDIKSSTDGVTWTTRHTVTAATNEAVSSFKPIWNGSMFLISGYSWDTTVLPYTFSNFVLTSADGVNWTRTNTSDAGRVVWNGSQFVLISSTKKYTSTDGITWSSGTNHNITDLGNYIIGLGFIDWTGTEYVGFTGGGGSSVKIWTSADAITWSSQTATPTQAVTCGAGSGSLYVAGGSQFTITSP